MKYHEHIKFPCGLEIEMCASISAWSVARINSYDLNKGCPLHGKTCPKYESQPKKKMGLK